MIKYYSINGEIVPVEKAYLHVSDLSILRGYGVFDFFRVVKGQPLFLKDYLERFHHSAQYLGMEMPVSTKVLMENIHQLIEANGLDDVSIRLVLTGGYATDGYTLPGKPNLLILSHPPAVYPASYFEAGIKLTLLNHMRENPNTKTTNYLTPIRLQNAMDKNNAFDVLYYKDSYISECSRSNFFIITKGNAIVTPDKKVLKGITRKKVLEIAKKHYNVEVRPVLVQEVIDAKEAFMTSSTKGPMPVVQLDNYTIGNGKVGSITKHLIQLFDEMIDNYIVTYQQTRMVGK